jgi:hypothetical protein
MPAADRAPPRPAWVDAEIAAATRAKPRAAATPKQAQAAVVAFSKAFAWSLHVPGTHASGPTFDELLGYLEASGRPFLKDTKALRAYVRTELLAFVERLRRAPTELELRDAAAKLVPIFVAKRLENKVHDVRIKRNEQRYLRRKLRLHGESRPGIATGQTLAALVEARATVTT